MREISSPDIAEENLCVDVCVVGGGMAGLCAAIASARTGARTVLVHDRPVLGGNASSEVRMWICGAHGKHNKETGILEEIQLENLYRNPGKDFSIWDSVLWAHATHQPGLQLFLNTTCTDCVMEGDRIAAVQAWQMTRQMRLTVRATQFIDCSGDSILAAASGALHRVGREARSEFGEGVAPQIGDDRTMGNSLLIQLHRTEQPQPFTPPDWAYRFEGPEDLPHRIHGVNGTNFWWIEIGGLQDTVRDAETIRDELMRTAWGLWDYIKNRAPERDKAANWALHWLGSLPGKRENRRIVGDHLLTQHDIEAGGRFDDVVAYGGWSMDDHHPAGLLYPGKPTIFHPAPSPYGIPYRCLYSRSVPNLFCAGRNISATHSAMSSTRVMGTTAVMGQAVGTAAALCVRHALSPRELGQTKLRLLQETLLRDDCFLPGLTRPPSLALFDARLSGDGQGVDALLDGWERDREDAVHAWQCAPGGCVEFRWRESRPLPGLRLVFDSDLCRAKRMACEYPLEPREHAMPAPLVREFSVEVEEAEGHWRTVFHTDDNRKRLVYVPLNVTGQAFRLRLLRTWGEGDARLFSVDLHDGPDTTLHLPAGKRWKEVVAEVPPEDLRDPDCSPQGRKHGGPAA